MGHTCAYWSLGLAQQPGKQSTPDVSNRISCRGLGYKIVKQDRGANGDVEYPAMSPEGKLPWPVAQRTPCSSPDGWSGARQLHPSWHSASARCVSPEHHAPASPALCLTGVPMAAEQDPAGQASGHMCTGRSTGRSMWVDSVLSQGCCRPCQDAAPMPRVFSLMSLV